MKKVILFLVVCIVVLTGCDFMDEEYEIYMIGHEFVSRNIKAPSTAKFQPYDVIEFKEVSENLYVYTSYVDSENSFGAMIRRNFVVKIEDLDNDGYKMIDLVFVKQ